MFFYMVTSTPILFTCWKLKEEAPVQADTRCQTNSTSCWWNLTPKPTEKKIKARNPIQLRYNWIVTIKW